MWFYITMQIISIAFQTLLACYLVREIATMKYSFWYITINRIRYMWSCGLAGFGSGTKNPELNEPYEWFKQNSVYGWMGVKLVTSMFFIFGLWHQMGSDQLMNKPKEFFFASPLSNYAIIFIIYSLMSENKRLRADNKSLRQSIINLATGR